MVTRIAASKPSIMEEATKDFLTTPLEAVTTTAADNVVDRQSFPDSAVSNHNTSSLSVFSRNSCDRCRQRKVRCDRLMPCQRCRKTGIVCSFSKPVKGRRGYRRQTKSYPDKFLDRLGHLERKLEGMSTRAKTQTQNSIDNHQSFEESVAYSQRRVPELNAPTLPSGLTTYASRRDLTSLPKHLAQSQPRRLRPKVNNETCQSVISSHEKPLSSRKTSWGRMSEEGNGSHGERVKQGTGGGPNHGLTTSVAAQYFKESQSNFRAPNLNTGYPNIDLHNLHPLSSQIPFLWEVYKENVDPLVKVLHLPSMDQRVRTVMHDPSSITPEMEALMFAIYYSVIGSMEDHEVSTDFGVQKSYLVRNFRCGVEQALLKVDYLNNSNLLVLQALTLFLVAGYRTEDSLFHLALTSLFIRLNQSLGIYSGAFQLSVLCPFEVEMRRRLWWTACMLDWKYSEHDGTEFIIAARAFCPEYPANINDVDISPDMSEFPCPRSGWTDMTLCNIQHRICSLARQIHVVAEQARPFSLEANFTIQIREELLLAAYEPVRQQCLRLLTDYNGEFRSEADALTVTRFVEASMRFITFQPSQLSVSERQIDKVRDLVLSSSIDIMHCVALVFSEAKYKRYRWALQSSTYLQAIGYLAIDLSSRPWCDHNLSIRSALEMLRSNTELWKRIRFPKHAVRNLITMMAGTIGSDILAVETDLKAASNQNQTVLGILHVILS